MWLVAQKRPKRRRRIVNFHWKGELDKGGEGKEGQKSSGVKRDRRQEESRNATE